jgi:hypothetical protein
VFEHLTAMRQLSRRERWGRRIERQRTLRPRLTAGSRALDAGTEAAEANRMTRADVVGFVLHIDLVLLPGDFVSGPPYSLTRALLRHARFRLR